MTKHMQIDFVSDVCEQASKQGPRQDLAKYL